MSQSLSVVIPARNAQSILAQQVHRLLELLPDLAPTFEIVVVDDASTDQTEEVALELAQRYPQVRLIRQPRSMGQQVAIRTGIQQTTSDVIFVQSDTALVSADRLRQLWELREDEQIVMAHADAPQLDAGMVNRLMEWGEQLKRSAPRGGLQMIRRRAVQNMSPVDLNEDQLAIHRVDRHESQAAQKTDRSGTGAKFNFHQI